MMTEDIERNRTTEQKLFNILAIGQSTTDGKIVCAICGECLSARQMQIDHIVPGAGDQPTNRQLLCPSCNNRKGSQRTHAEIQQILDREDQIEEMHAAQLARIKARALGQYAESPAAENDKDFQDMINKGTWASGWKPY